MLFFFFNDTATTEIYTLSLHDALPIFVGKGLATRGDIDHTEAHGRLDGADPNQVSDHAKMRGAEQCGTLGSGNHFLEDRKSTRLNSSHSQISYAVFCLKKKKRINAVLY